MWRFSTLLSKTRRAQAISRHVSTPRPSQHHQEGGGSHFLQGSVHATKLLWLPSYLPFIRGHASLLKLHQQCGLLSCHFIHTNARVKQPKQAMMTEIEIISVEYIKPASPTPNHLRTFKLSILGQFFFPSYTP